MSKINLEAKKERHKKLFEGHYQSRLGYLYFLVKRGIGKVWNFLTPSGRILPSFMHPLDGMPAPKRLYTTVAIWSLCILTLTSIDITSATFDESDYAYNYDELTLGDGFDVLSDGEGYIVKSQPLEGQAIYDQNRTEKVEHEVSPGDTLSVIAYRYGLNASTIKYANPSIGSGDYLKIGQKLTITPKDGYYIKVKKGDSLAKLVEKYKGNLDKTKEFNNIVEDSDLIADAELLVVDGRPEVVYIVSDSGKNTGYAAAPSIFQYNIPPNEQGWILPTHGRINQLFSGRHVGYDVGDRSQPPILASAEGLVVKANSGNYGGGYGNYIIIDHQNGYQTLYAHAEVLYVKEGDYIKQGQVIAKMGRTGRVRGTTGIHLHFEVSYNGKKFDPGLLGPEFRSEGLGSSW